MRRGAATYRDALVAVGKRCELILIHLPLAGKIYEVELG